MRPETLVFHADAAPDPVTKARITPIYQTPSIVFDDSEHAATLFNLEAGVALVVDNILVSPFLCQPIKHGADIVIHSLTKFLGGHGNSMGDNEAGIKLVGAVKLFSHLANIDDIMAELEQALASF